MMSCDTCAVNLFQDMKENYCVAQITIIVDKSFRTVLKTLGEGMT